MSETDDNYRHMNKLIKKYVNRKEIDERTKQKPSIRNLTGPEDS